MGAERHDHSSARSDSAQWVVNVDGAATLSKEVLEARTEQKARPILMRRVDQNAALEEEETSGGGIDRSSLRVADLDPSFLATNTKQNSTGLPAVPAMPNPMEVGTHAVCASYMSALGLLRSIKLAYQSIRGFLGFYTTMNAV